MKNGGDGGTGLFHSVQVQFRTGKPRAIMLYFLQYFSPRGYNHRMPISLLPPSWVPTLSSCQNKSAAFYGAGAEKHLPVSLPRWHGKGGGNGDDLGAILGQFSVEMRKNARHSRPTNLFSGPPRPSRFCHPLGWNHFRGICRRWEGLHQTYAFCRIWP